MFSVLATAVVSAALTFSLRYELHDTSVKIAPRNKAVLKMFVFMIFDFRICYLYCLCKGSMAFTALSYTDYGIAYNYYGCLF